MRVAGKRVASSEEIKSGCEWRFSYLATRIPLLLLVISYRSNTHSCNNRNRMSLMLSSRWR